MYGTDYGALPLETGRVTLQRESQFFKLGPLQLVKSSRGTTLFRRELTPRVPTAPITCFPRDPAAAAGGFSTEQHEQEHTC